MSETIKCTCSHCAAKYRLPIEAQGRHARCKRCGETFAVPRAQTSLEDSILDWLTEADPEEETTVQPRVINMPAPDNSDTEASRKARGPIRMKSKAGATDKAESA